MRRRPMQVAIEALLDLSGQRRAFKEAEPGDFWMEFTDPTGTWNRLVIEKVAEDEVSLTHYISPNSDAPGARDMRDPEIVFNTKTWQGVEMTNDLASFYQRVKPGHYSPGLEEFARIWARNLREQGFTEPGRMNIRLRRMGATY